MTKKTLAWKSITKVPIQKAAKWPICLSSFFL